MVDPDRVVVRPGSPGLTPEREPRLVPSPITVSDSTRRASRPENVSPSIAHGSTGMVASSHPRRAPGGGQQGACVVGAGLELVDDRGAGGDGGPAGGHGQEAAAADVAVEGRRVGV